MRDADTGQPAPPGLPLECEAYRSTPVFTEATVPAGLLRSHRTAPGTWALIRVLAGRLLYRALEPLSERVLDASAAPGLVEPGVPHEVVPLGPVRFQVEFYRMTGTAGRLERDKEADKRLSTEGCSSPPCMLRELDPTFAQHSETTSAPAGLPPASAGQDWNEVRSWRKIKRSVLIAQRLAISAAERATRSEAITAALVQVLPSNPGALIGFYWPFKGEYDPRALARSLHGRGIRLALPVVIAKATPVIFREWRPGATMIPGIWNIPVPAEGEPVSPDVLLVPVVGFDGRRYRLGYGGGYYDRTLAALSDKLLAVGVGFELSRIPTIYPQPHDIPMDLIVTECRVA